MRLEVLGPRTLRVRAHFGRQLFEPCAYGCMCVRACKRVRTCIYWLHRQQLLEPSAADMVALSSSGYADCTEGREFSSYGYEISAPQ